MNRVILVSRHPNLLPDCCEKNRHSVQSNTVWQSSQVGFLSPHIDLENPILLHKLPTQLW